MRGQRESREDERVERRVSAAEFGGRSWNESEEGRAESTDEAKVEEERERRLRRTGAELEEISLLCLERGRENEMKK